MNKKYIPVQFPSSSSSSAFRVKKQLNRQKSCCQKPINNSNNNRTCAVKKTRRLYFVGDQSSLCVDAVPVSALAPIRSDTRCGEAGRRFTQQGSARARRRSFSLTHKITTYKPKVTPPLARYNDSRERSIVRYTHRGCQKSASAMLPPQPPLFPCFPVASSSSSSFARVSPARAHSHWDGARTSSVEQKFEKPRVS